MTRPNFNRDGAPPRSPAVTDRTAIVRMAEIAVAGGGRRAVVAAAGIADAAVAVGVGGGGGGRDRGRGGSGGGRH